MPPVSAKDWEGSGPRRPAHSWESLSGKGTGASSTPQRRREAPGTPQLGRRPNSRAMASFSFFLISPCITQKPLCNLETSGAATPNWADATGLERPAVPAISLNKSEK